MNLAGIVLPVALGTLVGFPLGLTGAGGAILAVPVLVYGLSVPPHDAVGISLVTVGTTAWVGAIDRIRAREADIRAGVLLALLGMAGTPLGAWLGTMMDEDLLLGSFALLMLLVGLRMATVRPPRRERGPARDRARRWRRVQLVAIGCGIGVLAGLFGVGGGFLIVPSLVLLARLRMQTAVATSLMVIALVSTSGVISFLAAHGHLDVRLSVLFALGSFGGLALGSRLGKRVSGLWLRRSFAIFVLVVAIYVAARVVLS